MKCMKFYSTVAILLALAACGDNKRQQFATANESYITVLEVLLASKEAGKFTDEKWRTEIVPLIVLGDRLLDQYEIAATVAKKSVEQSAVITNITQRLGGVVTQLNKQLE